MSKASLPSPPQSIDLAPLTIRASVLAESVNAEARTVQVIFSTGAPVQRFDWMTGTRYIETLALTPKAVRLERLNNGAPFLNAHSAEGLSDVLGVVEPGSARMAKGQATAVVRFSKRDAVEPVWQDVRDGIIRNVSVGYRVHKYEQTEGETGELPRRHAVDWEPFEISAVPMGADDGAKVRADARHQNNPCVIVTRAAKETTMDPVETTEIIETNVNDPGAPMEPAQTTERAATEPNDRDAGRDAERARIEGILRAVRVTRLSQSLADKLIKDNTPLVEAQDTVLRALQEQDRGGPHVTGVRVEATDPNVNLWRGIENALLHRVLPASMKLDENGRNYAGLSLLESAKLCLQARGTRTTGMSKMEIAGRALGLDMRGGMHTTSDFAGLLADVANKTLRRAYEEAPQTFTPFARRVTLPDFKIVNRIALGEAPALLKVNEHGEYTRGTISAGKETFQLSTYGRVFAITRRALVNDDTDAFARIAMMFGRRARELETDLVWEQITSNPVMGDGTALFHANHGNLSASSDAISVTSVGAARAAMRLQKAPDGTQALNIAPRYLVVPAGKETVADVFIAPITPATSTAANPFSGRLQVLPEPRLDANSATAWYLFASSDQVDTIEYAFLEGEEGPVVETRVGFDVDGLETKCRHDFAAKVIDFRGFYKNPGA